MKLWFRRSLFLSLAALVAVVGLACSSDDDKPAANSPSSSSTTAAPAGITAAPQAHGKITVFAAASLTDSFNEIKAEFIKKNPRADIEFQFAGSPALRSSSSRAPGPTSTPAPTSRT